MPNRDNTDRDREIFQLHKQGWMRQDLAKRFNLSPERIRQIVLGDPQKKLRASRPVCLEGMIRLQDDLDMQWSCEIIVPVLGLKGWAKKRVGELFRRRRRKTISLRELMDLVMPHKFRSYFTSIPFLRYAGIGYGIHESTWEAMSACDFGPSFKAEWQQRMDYYHDWWEKTLDHA